MRQISVRDFRSNMASSLDMACAGEQVYIRRRNQLFAIIPVMEEDLTETPNKETLAAIDDARKGIYAGTVDTSSVDAMIKSIEE